MDPIFEALASAARRRILLLLADVDMTSGEIAARFSMSKPAISKHLKLLESAGLVGSVKEGQFVRYWLLREPLVGALGGFLSRLSAPAGEPTPPEGDDAVPDAVLDAREAARRAFAEQLRRAKEAQARELAER